MTRDFQQCGMCDQQSLRSACAYALFDQSLCLSLEYSMSVKLLTEHHLEFLSLKGSCTGPSESILVKMPHSWKSHVAAHFTFAFSHLLLTSRHGRFDWESSEAWKLNKQCCTISDSSYIRSTIYVMFFAEYSYPCMITLDY